MVYGRVLIYFFSKNTHVHHSVKLLPYAAVALDNAVLRRYQANKTIDVMTAILTMMLIEFTAAGTGLSDSRRAENTGAAADTGAKNAIASIFFTIGATGRSVYINNTAAIDIA